MNLDSSVSSQDSCYRLPRKRHSVPARLHVDSSVNEKFQKSFILHGIEDDNEDSIAESSSDTQTNSNSERENNLDISEEFKSNELVAFDNPEFKDSAHSQSVKEGESIEENNDSSSVGNYSGSSLFKMLKTVNSLYINSSQDDSDKGSNNDRNSFRRRKSRYSSLSRDSYHGKGNDELNRSWLSDISEESPYPEMKGSIKKICNLGQGSEGEVNS